MMGGMTDRQTKITFGEMREMGVRGLLIYCADYRCSHSIAVSADHWPDDLRLSDIEPRFGAAGFQLEQETSRRDGLSLTAAIRISARLRACAKRPASRQAP